MEKKKLTLKEIGLHKLIIIFMVGIFLIILSFPDILPTNKVQNKSSRNSLETTSAMKDSSSSIEEEGSQKYVNKLEGKLKNLLKKVAGVGAVEVMITLKASEERVTLKNKPYNQESITETDSAGGSRVSNSISKEDETVLIDDQEGDSIPYVVKETMPEIEGILIIAKGGGNMTIINEIIDAAMVLFDVPAHKIKVMKME